MRRNVNVLVASGTPAVLPARDATNMIPIVIVAALDPIATGVVTSLARPGGNLTGLTAVFADLTGKRLELLKELLSDTQPGRVSLAAGQSRACSICPAN